MFKNTRNCSIKLFSLIPNITCTCKICYRYILQNSYVENAVQHLFNREGYVRNLKKYQYIPEQKSYSNTNYKSF